jgi:hypothetical protein
MQKVTLTMIMGLFSISLFSQEKGLLVDSESYLVLNSVVYDLKQQAGNHQIYLLDKVAPEFILVKRSNIEAFKQLEIDSVDMEKYLEDSTDPKQYFDSTKINGCKIVRYKFFDSLQRNSKLVLKDKKSMHARTSFSDFPLYSISKPYFFGEYCLVSATCYSGFSTGEFGTLLYRKKGGNWKFVRKIYGAMM